MWFKKSSLNPTTPTLVKKELPDMEGGHGGVTTKANDSAKPKRRESITSQHSTTAGLAMPRPHRPFDVTRLSSALEAPPTRRAASTNPESLRGTPVVSSAKAPPARDPAPQRAASTRPVQHRTRTSSTSSSIPNATPDWGMRRPTALPPDTPSWGMKRAPLPSKDARLPVSDAPAAVKRSSSETRKDSSAVRRVPSDREPRSTMRDGSRPRRDSSGSRGRPSESPVKGILKNVHSTPLVIEDEFYDVPPPNLHWQLLGNATRMRNPAFALRFDVAQPFESISLLRRDTFRTARPEELKVAASDRVLKHMVIRNFQGPRNMGSIIVDVEANSGALRCYDILDAIYRKFHEPISSKHLALLSTQQLDTCARYLKRRCQRASANLPLWEEKQGLKYVDLLLGCTSFGGLQHSPTMPGEYMVVFDESSWVHG